MTVSRKPIHVGILFKRRFIEKYENLNMSNTAKALGVSRQRLSYFCEGGTRCTPEMAVRLAIATGTEVELWLTLQSNLDIWLANQSVTSNNSTKLDSLILSDI